MESEELLSALIQLSRSDDYFDEFEFTYILKVGRHLGVHDDKVENMIKSSLDLKLQIPKDEKDRMTILYYLLFLMKVDNIIHEEEKAMVHHYGLKLGFSQTMINEFISLMEKSGTENLDTEEMLTIIRKYQN